MTCASYLRIKDALTIILSLPTKYRTHWHGTIIMPNHDPEFNFFFKVKEHSNAALNCPSTLPVRTIILGPL